MFETGRTGLCGGHVCLQGSVIDWLDNHLTKVNMLIMRCSWCDAITGGYVFTDGPSGIKSEELAL